MSSRLLTILVLLMTAWNSVAQSPDSAALERLMEQYGAASGTTVPDASQLLELQKQAMEMQSCLAGVDHTALEALRVEGEAVAAEVRALCAAGNRTGAEARARDYGQRVMAAPAMQAIKGCGAMVSNMLAGLADFVRGDAAGEAICSGVD